MTKLIATTLATAAMGLGLLLGAGTAQADTCKTSYYGSAWHTYSSDGSSAVCYPGGRCHYQDAPARNPYSQILEGLEELR
ncbi:hypothetical protein [Mycobacterium sp. URHB0021]